MARSRYIYLIHPKGSNEPLLATFTVKHESQTWAEQSVHGIENLERTRMEDNPKTDFIGTRILVPWEKSI